MQVSVGKGAPSARVRQILACCPAPLSAHNKAFGMPPLSGHLMHGAWCEGRKGESLHCVSGSVGTNRLMAGWGITSGYLAFSTLREKWSQKMEEGEYLLPNGCDYSGGKCPGKQSLSSVLSGSFVNCY